MFWEKKQKSQVKDIMGHKRSNVRGNESLPSESLLATSRVKTKVEDDMTNGSKKTEEEEVYDLLHKIRSGEYEREQTTERWSMIFQLLVGKLHDDPKWNYLSLVSAWTIALTLLFSPIGGASNEPTLFLYLIRLIGVIAVFLLLRFFPLLALYIGGMVLIFAFVGV